MEGHVPTMSVEVSSGADRAAAMLKSRSESALRSAKPVGMVDVRTGSKPNGTWVVHNSLVQHSGGHLAKAQSETAIPQVSVT